MVWSDSPEMLHLWRCFRCGDPAAHKLAIDDLRGMKSTTVAVESERGTSELIIVNVATRRIPLICGVSDPGHCFLLLEQLGSTRAADSLQWRRSRVVGRTRWRIPAALPTAEIDTTTPRRYKMNHIRRTALCRAECRALLVSVAAAADHHKEKCRARATSSRSPTRLSRRDKHHTQNRRASKLDDCLAQLC
jgi:hypothetical protein